MSARGVSVRFKISLGCADRHRMNRLLLVAGVLAVVAASGCGAIANLAENDVDKLEAGDCFELDSLPAEVGQVQRKVCFGSNVAHVAGWADFSDYDEYLERRDFNGILANWCSRFLDDWQPRSRVEGVSVGWLVPTEASWDAGERRALCYYTDG